jgi:hypothetical protein
MRRIALALILVAAAVGIHACAADAPTAPKPGTGGGTSSAVSVQLFTTDANPKAGTCTLIEALVSLNGSPVPDGTSVNFSTDFGAFGQNGLPLVSIVTTNGAASAALCGPAAGSAKVKGQVTVAGKTNSGNLAISFQPGSGALPQVSYCNPSFGPVEGGTPLTLNGVGFSGSASTTRVQFTVNGVTKDGIVSTVTPTAISVTTPGFQEFGSPSLQAAITLTLVTNSSSTPVVLSLPSCFAYGTQAGTTPTVTAVLPASGTNQGNTRVTIIGSGFSTGGVQVFFGTVEATVISVSYNQVLVLSPPAFGAGDVNLNKTVDVTVKNIGSGLISPASATFTYTPAIRITAVSNGTQSVTTGFSPVTIYGQGFQAPVAVTLAGVPAFVQSVSSTELVVLPSLPLTSGCANVTGAVSVTNIDTGDAASGLSFTYLVPQLVITSLAPQVGVAGATVTITGTNFPLSIPDAEVTFGGRIAFVTSVTPGSLNATVPPGAVSTSPTCTGTNVPPALQNVGTAVDVKVKNRQNSCEATVPLAFTYQLPCVAPTPGP